MANKPLLAWQKDDAARLRALWDAYRHETGTSQESVAGHFDFNQSAFSQYINGVIPLNLSVMLDFAHLLKCRLSDISPTLAAKVYRWVDDAKEQSSLSVQEYLDIEDFKLLNASELQAIEAMVKHFVSAKRGNPPPGKVSFRPKLVGP